MVHNGKHRWAMSWPGNFCMCCGADDVTESAICCPTCTMPLCPEEEGIVPFKLCEWHERERNIPCPCTKEHEDGWRM